MATNGSEIVATYKKLAEERLPYEDLWDDAFRLSYPMRGQRFERRDDNPISTALNMKRDKAILFDTTGRDAARLLASSMLSGLTPPNMQWFNLQIPEGEGKTPPHDAKAWLEKASKKLFKMIHASNYDAEAYEFFLDMVIGGMCGLYCEMTESGFKFEFWPLETLYVSETMKTGFIDSVYRRVNFTAEQAVNRFGMNNIPEGIRQAYEADPHNKKLFSFVHVIRPRLRNGKQTQGKFKKTLPFESAYVDIQSKMVVQESGYHEFPVVIPRWMKIPEGNYAVGPYDDALPDIKTLNQIVRLMLTNADMAIAGTYVAKDDGVLNPNTTKIGPRKIVFAANPDNIKPLTSAGDFRVTGAEIERLQRNIRRILMSDQLQPTEGPQMTATEVHVRVNLVRQLLGPIFGRFQAEFLQPLIERTFGLAYRAGYFGDPPESLGDTQFIPQYSSPLARAQKQEDVQAMAQFEQSMASVLQIQPEVMDLYDFDSATRKKAELIGVPVDMIREEREVKRIREERAKQQQAMAEREAAQQEQEQEQ